MSRTCELCGRGYLKSASRSHSNIKTLKRQYVNLQTKVVKGVRKLICTRCVKSLTKLPRTPKVPKKA